MNYVLKAECEYKTEEEKDALESFRDASANEHLGGWSIIRANIQDARQPS